MSRKSTRAAEKGMRRFYAEAIDAAQLKQRLTDFLMKHGLGKTAVEGSAFSVQDNASRARTAEETWEVLNRRYTERRRYYHSWGHIAFMLQLLDQFCGSAPADQLPRYPVPLEAAVWFHDAVQFCGSENERLSAELAVQLLRRSGMQIDYVLRAAELIRSTEIPADACRQESDSDTDLLHDLDYAVLGTPENLFLRYEQAVRLEYAHLSDEAYAAGRSRFLRMLQESGIFRTLYFSGQYEEQALHNISMQLERFGKFSGG
jgi:predicted metal-dependent HD superfamily phosphohydrolase